MGNIKELLKEGLSEFKGEFLKEVDEVVETKVKAVTPEVVKQIIHEMQIGQVNKVPEMSKDTKKDMNKFFRALFEKDFVSAKALSEGTDSAGGYLVPEEFSAKIIDLVTEKYGVVRPKATIQQMSSDTLNFPTITSKPKLSWVNEGSTIPSDQPQYGQIVLVAKKASLIIPVTNELLSDSKVDLSSMIADIFAWAQGYSEDEQSLAGTGSPFVGVFGNANVNTVTMDSTKTNFTDVTADNLLDLVYAVPAMYAGNSVFILNREVLAVIRKLKDNNGQYIFDPRDKTLFGYPVLESDVMPGLAASAADTPFVIFGDLSEILLGDRLQMSIALADQATVGSNNLFEQDMTAFRVVIREAIAVRQPKAFAVLKTAAS